MVWCMNILDVVYKTNTKGNELLDRLYKELPFAHSLEQQTPGNVIHYVLVQARKRETYTDRDGRTKAKSGTI
jgi:hypothetical protein